MLEEGVDNWSAFRDKWGLQKVTEKGEDWVERLEFMVSSHFELDPLTNLAQDNQVQDNWSSQ